MDLTTMLQAGLAVCAMVFTGVLGLTSGHDDFSLQIVSLTRAVSGDWNTTTIDIDFIADKEPDAEWTYHDGSSTITIPATMDFQGNHGTASATFQSKHRITVKFGYFYTHFLRLFIIWDLYKFIMSDLPNNQTQTLNTQWATSSAGYDVAYTTGESFTVTMTSPKHVAENFTWSRFWENDEYDVRVNAVWIDDVTNKIRAANALENGSVRKFVEVEKTLGEDVATMRLNFTSAEHQFNGYIEQFTLHEIDDKESPYIVEEIWETVHMNVHEDSNPGPFPAGYNYVRNSGLVGCSDKHYCFFYCYGYGNDLVEAHIYKLGENESRQELTETEVSFSNSNRVVFNVDLDHETDISGEYVCEITSRDGTTGTAILDVPLQ